MEKNNDNSIGRAIKKGLEKKDMSQKELSIIMGVNKSTVSSWISGLIVPPGDKLLKIIRNLDILPELFPEYRNQEHSLLKENHAIYNNASLAEQLKQLTNKITILESKMEHVEKKLGS